jgi:hypothetical protein
MVKVTIPSRLVTLVIALLPECANTFSPVAYWRHYLKNKQSQYNFNIPFRLPTLNEYMNVERGNRYKAAAWKRETEDKIFYTCFAGNKVPVTFVTPVTISFWWHLKDRRLDWDNVMFGQKFILDSLVGHKIIPNDGQKWIPKPPLHDGIVDGTESVTVEITECLL